ncbi:helix-turn-helix transcriptional regulator [Brevibacillus sp. BC25]|uniref:helix-turn-helix transcriptional regulator n=1 Tax=Brevibacillus sp. BC25 TaxID=1144308 RepID=UPI0002713065|nr:helix-turn-helix transcriptional regulator [Brevibacillus sp. BC25]EJL29996.1 putative transcriptional regulator [Brevibacillus sp. BC25]
MRDWLKTKREEKGMNQEQVALESEISRSYYTLIESGSKTPGVKVAKKIAKVLDLEWTKFFDEKCSLKELSA